MASCKWANLSEEASQRNRKERIVWGRRIPLGGCDAQEVAICEFHFVATDYGDAIRLSEDLGRETKNIDNREPNRCVLLHLVDGMQWARMKRKQAIPEKQKVMLEVEEWRREDISHAQEALKWCGDRDGPMASELRSLAHDVVNVGNDRDYRGLAVFFHDIMPTNQVNVRVFGLRAREAGGYELRVSYFQTPGGDDWPIADLLALKHHMRRLKTRADILPSV